MDKSSPDLSLTRSTSHQRRTNTPSILPQQLQSHLFDAFISGETADISVSVHGAWNATYSLHRIVLTQAGFFRSLFTSGFSESFSNARISQGCVDIRFDDPNISRAAFEICLSRLYGGGPPLHVCPSIYPTSEEPLTTAFMKPWLPTPAIPKDHHPASPRFLLSLLSTAFYLSIPQLASEVLNIILSTIGPTTIIRYLDYALGKGVGPANPIDPEKAVTLEHIGKDHDAASVCTTNTETTIDSATSSDDAGRDSKFSETSAPASRPLPGSPSFLYGTVSNKIGEACAAFLTRWGVDLLTFEENQPSNQVASPTPLSSSCLPPINSTSSVTWRPTAPPLRIWSHGLSAEWVRGILSSDELFIENEMKRYEAAKQVVDMRRRLKGIIPEEEKEWDILFQEGIYYSHFPWDELLLLSEDRSPVTGAPYVPLSRLQAAHWSYSKFQQMITKSRDPTKQDLKLGLEVETSEICSAQKPNAGSDVYWPVPFDTSLRIGDPGNAAPTEDFFNPSPSRDQFNRRSASASNFFGVGNLRTHKDLIDSDPNLSRIADRWVSYEPFRFSVEFWGVESLKEKTRLYSHTVWYAGSCYNVYTQAVRKKGLQLGVYLHRQSNVDPIPAASAPRASLSQTSPQTMHSPLPASESVFSNNSQTMIMHQSRSRLRSRPSSDTLSIRGVVPGPSSRSPPPRSTTPVAIPRPPPRYMHSNASFSHFSPTSPLSSPGSHPALSSTPSQLTSVAAPHQPYRDPRPAISAYFSIACHSSTGSSLTRFSSGPDTFAVSQSWGWKSSSLDIVDPDDQTAPETSLRATVVMGLV